MPLTITDIQGALAQMKSYIEDTLGFDRQVTLNFEITPENSQLTISARDGFQQKREWSEQIGRLSIWETDKDAGKVLQQAWASLRAAMPRDERELRFGLAQLGDAIEGGEFNTAIGRLVYERMKAVRDDISAKFLPRFTDGVEASHADIEPAPQSGHTQAKELDDEIPF